MTTKISNPFPYIFGPHLSPIPHNLISFCVFLSNKIFPLFCFSSGKATSRSLHRALQVEFIFLLLQKANSTTPPRVDHRELSFSGEFRIFPDFCNLLFVMSSSSLATRRANEIRARAKDRVRDRKKKTDGDGSPKLTESPEDRRRSSVSNRRLILASDDDDDDNTMELSRGGTGGPFLPQADKSSSGSFADSIMGAFRRRERFRERPLTRMHREELSEYLGEGSLPHTDKGKQPASPSESEGETPRVSHEEEESDPEAEKTEDEGSPMDEDRDENAESEDADREDRKERATRRAIRGLMQSGYTEEEAKMAFEERQCELRARRRKSDPRRAYAVLSMMGFKGTIYPHRETMDRLQISRDVDLMFEACGISHLMSSVSGCTREETLQFLATVQLHEYDETVVGLLERDGGGYITFRVRGSDYRFTLRQIQELFRFPPGIANYPSIDEDEVDELWLMLSGSASFDPSRSKGNSIRNPCINYMRRAVANVLFARPTTSPMTLGEMHLLVTVLKEVVSETPSGRQITGDEVNSGLAFVLARHLTSYRAKADTLAKRGSSKPITVGGVVHQILEACNVVIDRSEWVAPRFLDLAYLKKADIVHLQGGHVIYRFRHPEEAKARIVLPCPELTSIRMGRNADFIPPLSSLLHSQAQLEAPPIIPAQSEEIQPDEIEPEEYFFEEYTAPRLGAATREAHKHIGMLQKVSKWLVKKVKGLVKEKKEWKLEREQLRREMDALKERYRGESSQAPAQLQRRHSVSVPETREQQPTPGRHSSAEGMKVYRRGGSSRRRANSRSQLEQPGLELPQAETEAVNSRSQLERTDLESTQQAAPGYTLESMDASTAHLFDF